MLIYSYFPKNCAHFTIQTCSKDSPPITFVLINPSNLYFPSGHCTKRQTGTHLSMMFKLISPLLKLSNHTYTHSTQRHHILPDGTYPKAFCYSKGWAKPQIRGRKPKNFDMQLQFLPPPQVPLRDPICTLRARWFGTGWKLSVVTRSDRSVGSWVGNNYKLWSYSSGWK